MRNETSSLISAPYHNKSFNTIDVRSSTDLITVEQRRQANKMKQTYMLHDLKYAN